MSNVVNLSIRLWDPASYAYNPYALPLLVCALATLVFGIIVVVRDRGSRIGVVYSFESIAISTWFFGFGMAGLATDAEIADGWFRLAHVSISYIPALTLLFACRVAGTTAKLRRFLWAGWIVGSAFAIAGLTWRSYFGIPYHYSWGYYAHYTPYSASFIPFAFLFFSLVAFVLSRRTRRASHPSSDARGRARLIFAAFAAGSLGTVDFVPALGVPIYAFGYLPVLAGIGLAAYVILHYRSMRITLEFAARQIVATVSDGLLLLDRQGVVRVANDALLSMVALPKEEIIGRRIPRALRTVLTVQEVASLQAGVPMHNREIEYVRRDGMTMNLSFAVSVIRGHGKQVQAYVCAVRDVTEQKRIDQRVRFLAYYDNLTGLPNRQQFEEHLRGALARAARDERQVALLFVDLDYFKRINDTLGHALGDGLLQAVAGRVLGCVRKIRAGNDALKDTIARLGGDEFIVGLYDLESRDDATRVAERILASIADPIRLGQREISVTASLGISMFPEDGGDADTLMKHADAAMYQAKQAGRNDFVFYGRPRASFQINRPSLEQKLRKALERSHLTLHYQPQVAIHSGHAIGVEALLRWHDPDFGSVAAQRIISIAEKTGLILPIGDWVLQQACVQARAWHDAGLPIVRVAVNLSGQQFRDSELVGTVRHALKSARLGAESLEVELTEGMVTQNVLHTRRTLEALKAAGVQVSIDDFGTGYSALGDLRSFPIDTLKIDRAFVHDIGRETDNGNIVAAIIAMARSLKIGVIGEGVETEEQRAFLQMHGCKLVQGFFFCEPLPADELATWLQTRTASQAT